MEICLRAFSFFSLLLPPLSFPSYPLSSTFETFLDYVRTTKISTNVSKWVRAYLDSLPLLGTLGNSRIGCSMCCVVGLIRVGASTCANNTGNAI